jgi:hypothetical protein
MPVRCKPIAVAWCENDVGSGSAPPPAPSDGPVRWNLPELGGDGMFPTLRQQFSPCFLSQMLQHIQLLVESLGPTAHAGLRDLAQPLAAMTGIVDVPARAGNSRMVAAFVSRMDSMTNLPLGSITTTEIAA